MSGSSKLTALIIGISLFLGLSSLGYLIGDAAIKYKEYERKVTVKGLSEREFKADVVIWPIEFTTASNNLEQMYQAIDISTNKIEQHLQKRGITADEISFSAPAITDKTANQYGGQSEAKFRYSALQTVTVYSTKIDTVRKLMQELSILGKQGIVFSGNSYRSQAEYLFTRLNEVKPAMIEEATRKAREVAQKFASDSNSVLGKISTATQGQFSISARDKSNPHIKKVRVVSTVAYYLSD